MVSDFIQTMQLYFLEFIGLSSSHPEIVFLVDE